MRSRISCLGFASAILFLSLSYPLKLKKITRGILAASAQAQTTQNLEAESSRLFQLGIQQFKLGQFRDALETFYQVLMIEKKLGNKAGEGTALNNLALIYDNLGQYPKALEFYLQSLAIDRELGDKAGEGTTLNNIGLFYSNLGQYTKALDFYQQALAIQRELRNRWIEGAILNNIAGVYSNLGEYSKALELYQQVLAIKRELNDKVGEGRIFNGIGFVYFSLNEYDKALTFYQQALAIHTELGNQLGEAPVLNNIGLVYDKLGESSKALEFYQSALAIITEAGNKTGEREILANIGGVYLNIGQYTEASKVLLAAIEISESERPGLTDADKVSIFERQVPIYYLLQEALVAQDKITTALEISERGKARAFVELLARKLSDNPNNQPTVNSLTIQEIQLVAKAQNATIVEYSRVSDDKLFIWVIQPTGKVAFKSVGLQSLNVSLEDLVTSSRKSIGVRGRGLGVTARVDSVRQVKQFQQLYKFLIEPIAEFLPKDPNERVIFIPQNELFLVPFPALQDTSGQYLIEKHTILTAPSIQVLQLTQEKRESLGTREWGVGNKEFLIVGNPTMPSNITTPLGESIQLSPLPGAEKEALAIAQLLNTKALTGNQATKASVEQQMEKARIIHLATHGLLDDFKGLGIPGALALAPSIHDNGLLTSSEILEMKLNTELVVLSACDTGRGTITSDGVIGLSRSLISAGVPSVIVSLWAVPDAPTASLMTQFYQNLFSNPDKAQALRNAMVTTMKHHPNPRDWAAFTLIGEP